MKRATSALAFLASLASLLVLVGGGLALLVVPDSGELATGALLAFCGAVAFACVLALVFTPEERFQESTWRAGAVAAAVIGAMPVAGLAAAAFRFAGLPIGSAIPMIDWSIFAAGAALALGAVSILALGVLRARTVGGPSTVIHMQQIRDAQLQLRTALEASAPRAVRDEDEDEVRVRRV